MLAANLARLRARRTFLGAVAGQAACVRAIGIVPSARPGALRVYGDDGRVSVLGLLAGAMAALGRALVAAGEDGFAALTALEVGALLEALPLQGMATGGEGLLHDGFALDRREVLEFVAEEGGWNVAAGQTHTCDADVALAAGNSAGVRTGVCAVLEGTVAGLVANGTLVEEVGVAFHDAWVAAAETPLAALVTAAFGRKEVEVGWIGDVDHKVGMPGTPELELFSDVAVLGEHFEDLGPHRNAAAGLGVAEDVHPVDCPAVV